MSLGTVVCNGVTVPIVRISLEHNEIVMHCALIEPGNHAYTLEGPYTIFGADGSGILQGGWERPETYHTRRGGGLFIELPVRFTSEERRVQA